jgi:hypothetical protein
MNFDIKEAVTDAEIARVYLVMRELRPHIKTEAEFVERAQRQRKIANWQLIYVEDAGKPVAASGFRISEWLVSGKTLYVDDLICLESHRGEGFAEALMHWMEDFARKEGCASFELDSGTHRLGAHRFYHRLKMAITAFHFRKAL